MAKKKEYKYYTRTITCPDGSRKYIRAKTRKELEQKYAAAKAEVEMGVNINSRMTVAEWAQTWFDTYKRPTLRADTLANQMCRVNKHILPALGTLRVRDVRPAHILNMFASEPLVSLSHGSQRGIYSLVRQLFNAALENRLITTSPLPVRMTLAGRAEQKRTPLTRDQSRRLLDAALGTPIYPFVLIGLSTGMRRGEILGLQWEDVDLENKIIHVRHQLVREGSDARCHLTTDLKTESSQRDIPITSELLLYLRSAAQERSTGYVLLSPKGTPYTLSTIKSVTDALAKLIEVPVFPHLLRHTYCTRLIESGLPIKYTQYLLGHATVEMTLDRYAHYQAEQEHAAEIDAARKAASVAFG